jgi:glutamate synthase domain-containing protein 3
MPWELGIAEAQQTLVMNNLRGSVRLQVDGQLKTGRDVVIATLLGAEEYGFATSVLIAMGCVLMRVCQKNSCPVGVATQDPELRKRFKGKPEYIINFLMFVAEEVREYLAQLGLRSLDEAVGRTDLLDINSAIDYWKTQNLDFSNILATVAHAPEAPVRYVTPYDHGVEKFFDQRFLEFAQPSLEQGRPMEAAFPVANTDRAVGTLLSYETARRYGHAGLPDDTIRLNFRGTAGQSFGAFLAHGITLQLTGEANDYLGKGLSGGKIIVRPSETATYQPEENIIAGNVLLYGAINGKVFINGKVGERFAVRNSGATAVVEGTGNHCCEYMTGGCVVVLGETGVNFGAGMSGGYAFVLDEDGSFDRRCNLTTIDLEPVIEAEDVDLLRSLIEEHVQLTGSPLGQRILDHWNDKLPQFVKVFPMEYRKALGRMTPQDANIVRTDAHN